MTTKMDIDYALMAGHAYRTTCDQINWIPAPSGWTPFFPVPDESTASAFPVGSTGFEAISFKRGNEIVISFAGTDPKGLVDTYIQTTGDRVVSDAIYGCDSLQSVKGKFVQAEGATGYLAWVDGYSPATRV